MQIANLYAVREFVAQHMHPQRRRGSEVHSRRSNRHLVIGKQRSPAQFEVRLKPSARGEIPLQSQRIKTCSVRRVVALEYHKDRHSIEHIFKTSLENSRTMGLSQNPSIAETYIPDAGIGCAAGHRRTAACPHLDFVTAISRTVLCPCH